MQADFSETYQLSVPHYHFSANVPRPDAIFAANDVIGYPGVMRAARETGITIPGQLAVVGFDDIPSGRTGHPFPDHYRPLSGTNRTKSR